MRRTTNMTVKMITTKTMKITVATAIVTIKYLRYI